jgi:hypothetical protein
VHLSSDQMDVYVACGNIEDDDAAMDDDAVAEDDDEAMTDDEDAAEEEDDAAMDDEDDAVAEDDEEAMTDDEDAVEEDDAADDAEDLVPATGGVAGFGAEAGMLLVTLAAGLTLGAGVLIRRRSLQF